MRISDWSSDVCSSDLFITGATGEFGTKVDLDFKLTRSSDGEGSVEFVVVHRNDGSEVGRIVREAKFASIPELDDVQAQLKSALSGFIMGAYSTSMGQAVRSEEHTSELQSLMRLSYAVFCLKKKKTIN